MIEPDDDPLWYDRVEPDPETGWLVWTIAALFVGTFTLFNMPGRAYDACERKLVVTKIIKSKLR